MGNYRFKLSEFLSNSWFYKLRDMSLRGKSKKKPTSTSPTKQPSKIDHILIPSHPRKSLHFTRQLVEKSPADPPKKSPKLKPRRRPNATAIILENKPKTCTKNLNDSDELKSPPKIELPPIITKSMEITNEVKITKKEKSSAKQHRNSPSRKFIVNSPRVSSKRFNQRRKSVSSNRSLADSLAIVKSSDDPHRDFRESMVEMIIENKISGSNELENLLACYLSLNAHEYHGLIIEVFRQIWFDMTEIGVK